MVKTINKYHIHLIYILLAVVTFIAFEPIIHNSFISFDDGGYIFDNSYVTSGLTLKSIIWAFTNVYTNNYHPLTLLSHMLDCEFYGTNPGGHHFTNLLFHIANTLLLFLVLGHMTKKVWASAFVAALFALHPLHVESVAWASERKDTLSTFFWMLTILAYMRYVERSGTGRYLLTLVLFVLGLLSKPMLVTLPFVLLLLDHWPLNRFGNTRLRRLILEKIPFFVLSAILSIITFMIQQKIGLLKSFSDYPLQWRIENALVSYIIYIEKMFWPVSLAIFYPHPKGDIPLWQITGAVLALVLITSLALWKLRQRPYIAVGWLWFLGTLVPVIGVFQIGIQARADRYTYIPYIGLFIIIAWGISNLLARLRYRKVIFSLSAGILLSALGIKTYIQTIYWHNDILLYKHAAEVVENNWWAHYFLGKAFALQKEFEEAIIQFKETLRIDPENATIYNEMAKAFLDKGDVNEAVRLYQDFLPPLPEDLNEPRGMDTSLAKRNDILTLAELYANANINFATALVRQGNIDQAVRRFEEALRVAPDSAIKCRNLAKSLCQSGRLEDSVRIYQMIVQLMPNDSEVYTGLGIALVQQGKLDEAVSCFTKVVSIEPHLAGGYINLGNALNLQSKSNEAIDCYIKAVQLEPDSVLAHYRLGRILVQRGEIDEAIVHFNQAIRIDPNYIAARESLGLVLAEKQKLQNKTIKNTKK